MNRNYQKQLPYPWNEIYYRLYDKSNQGLQSELLRLYESYDAIQRTSEKNWQTARELRNALEEQNSANTRLRQHLEVLDTENTELRKEIERLRLMVDQVISRHSQVTSDKSVTSDLSTEHQVNKTFDSFKFYLSQTLEYSAQQLISNISFSSGTERREVLAKIKSALSSIVLVEMFNLFSNDKSANVDMQIGSALSKLHSALLTYGVTPLPSLQVAVSDGIQLVKQFIDSELSYKLLWAQLGDVFDESLHEAERGSEETGRIIYSVLPGLQIGNRILAKNVVVTSASAR